MPGYEARILDDDGREVPRGEIGNLWVKGDSVCACYWNQHEKTKQTIQGDWLRTGAPFGDPAKDKVVKLEVSKAEFFFQKPGEKEKILTTAHYADGSTRNVTAEASVTS